MEGFSDKPFAVGSLIGLRSWGIHSKDNQEGFQGLRSLFKEYHWQTGINIAKCMRQPTYNSSTCIHKTTAANSNPLLHTDKCYNINTCDGLDIKCSCGFWAYTNGDNDYYHNSTWSLCEVSVAGIVEGFGRCIIGSRGFRAEKCRIIALVLPVQLKHGYYAPRDESLIQKLTDDILKFYPSIPTFPSEDTALKEFPLTVPDIEPKEADEFATGLN